MKAIESHNISDILNKNHYENKTNEHKQTNKQEKKLILNEK